MTADLDRKIVTVRYNLLNLPDTIQYYEGSMTVNHYLADGTRLSSVHHTVLDGVVVPVGSVCNVDTIANVTTSGSAYCQNIEYEMQADGTPAISRVFNSEGFIAGILPTAQAAYYCRDAQGNITSVWRVDAGYPYQTTHYYADGHIKNNSTSTSFQPYLYSGKELQRMHGYDCYDYGARHSQTTLGRFTTMDPLAENDPETSPYALCKGNPVRYIDPDGRWAQYAVGAIIGAAGCATITAIQGGSGSEIAAAAVGGAVAGAVMTASFGLGGGALSAVTSGVVGGAAGDFVEQRINIWSGNSAEYDLGQTAVAAGTGGLLNWSGRTIKNYIENAGVKTIERIKQSYSTEAMHIKKVNEVKSDYKYAGKPITGHSTKHKINIEADTRVKTEMEHKIQVSGANTKLEKNFVDFSAGAAGTVINRKIDDIR